MNFGGGTERHTRVTELSTFLLRQALFQGRNVRVLLPPPAAPLGCAEGPHLRLAHQHSRGGLVGTARQGLRPIPSLRHPKKYRVQDSKQATTCPRRPLLFREVITRRILTWAMCKAFGNNHFLNVRK